jgi:hypothetical protein
VLPVFLGTSLGVVIVLAHSSAISAHLTLGVYKQQECTAHALEAREPRVRHQQIPRLTGACSLLCVHTVAREARERPHEALIPFTRVVPS